MKLKNQLSSYILGILFILISISCSDDDLCTGDPELYWNEVSTIIYTPRLNIQDTIETSKGVLVYTLYDCKGQGDFLLYDKSGSEVIMKGYYKNSLEVLRRHVQLENWMTGAVTIELEEYYEGIQDGVWEYYQNGELINTVNYGELISTVN